MVKNLNLSGWAHTDPSVFSLTLYSSRRWRRSLCKTYCHFLCWAWRSSRSDGQQVGRKGERKAGKSEDSLEPTRTSQNSHLSLVPLTLMEKLVLLVAGLYMFLSQDSEMLKEEIWWGLGELQANCYPGQQHEPAGQRPQAPACGTNADPRSEHNIADFTCDQF